MSTLQTTFTQVNRLLKQNRLNIKYYDLARPWGGFLVIDEKSLIPFLNTYFPELQVEFPILLQNKLSPKILLVAPQTRLSWQYHLRREELWKVVAGPVGIVQSDNDLPNDITTHQAGELIKISYLRRHRLVGDTEWGIVAEIWKHTDPNNPSDEDDIIRVSDDFGRK